MTMVNSFRYFILFAFLNFVYIVPAVAQNEVDTRNSAFFKIESGTVLTGFSLGWTKASRDDFNSDFERGFTRLALQTDALYFFNDRIGVGPVLGYQYIYRDFENFPGDFGPDARDHWEWNFEYGAKAGWYVPIHEFFGNESLGHSLVFVNGGVSWLYNTTKVEGFERTGGINENRFGYQVATGLLLPLGKQIALETELKWEARKRQYSIAIRNENGTVIRTIEEAKWPSILSLGIGLTVVF